MSILISGCGDIGQQLVAYLRGQGHTCQALVRSKSSQTHLQTQGIDTLRFDLDSDSGLSVSAEVIYYFIPPQNQGREDLRIRRFLAQLPSPPKKLILLSTTGVYGDCQGDWITEQRPLNPQADRAYRRADAEQQVQAYCQAQHCQWLILRVPGIYGVNKLPLKRLAAGKAILAPEASGYSNRIHSHDLVRACGAAMQAPIENMIIHLSDGNPSSMSDYFLKVAHVFALPTPTCLSKTEALAQLSPEMLSYLLESKRLDTQKMREVLGVVPDYPDLDTGLAMIKQAIDSDVI